MTPILRDPCASKKRFTQSRRGRLRGRRELQLFSAASPFFSAALRETLSRDCTANWRIRYHPEDRRIKQLRDLRDLRVSEQFSGLRKCSKIGRPSHINHLPSPPP